MLRNIGIMFIVIMNIITFLYSFLLIWFIFVGLSYSGALATYLLGMLAFVVGVAIEVLKWMSFYYVVNDKNRKWVIFYGIYGGLLLVLYLGILQMHQLFLIPFFYFLGLSLVLNKHNDRLADLKDNG